MKSTSQSAYRLAPWRKQMKRIITILMVTFAVAAITLIYLSISERMTNANLRIQQLQSERSEYSRNIADLTTEEGVLTAYKAMVQRAEQIGFSEIDFEEEDQYAYVIVDGYTGTGINTEPPVIDIISNDYVSLVKPEYTESLQEWLYKRITTGIESYEVTN